MGAATCGRRLALFARGRQERDILYSKFVEMNKEVNVRHSSGSNGVKRLFGRQEMPEKPRNEKLSVARTNLSLVGGVAKSGGVGGR